MQRPHLVATRHHRPCFPGTDWDTTLPQSCRVVTSLGRLCFFGHIWLHPSGWTLWGHCMTSAAGFPPCWPGASGDNEGQRQGLGRAPNPRPERGLAGQALSCGKASSSQQTEHFPVERVPLNSESQFYNVGRSPIPLLILGHYAVCSGTPHHVLQGRLFCLVRSARRMEEAKLGGRGLRAARRPPAPRTQVTRQQPRGGETKPKGPDSRACFLPSESGPAFLVTIAEVPS